MGVVANFKKLLRWGPRGLWLYLHERLKRRALIQRLRASYHDGLVPVRGVTVVGNLTALGSNSKTLRDLVRTLSAANIPYQTFDLNSERDADFPEAERFFTAPDDFILNRFDHLIEFAPSVVGHIPGVQKARIIFWEFESGLLYGYPDAPNEECVIAMSDFNARYFRQTLPEKVAVRKILYPFQCAARKCPHDSETVRAKYGWAADDFVVFYNFDLGSGFHRKNPDGVLRTFAMAFANEPKAKLLFKTSGVKRHPERIAQLRKLAHALGVAGRYAIETGFLSETDLASLFASCDVYISLHRGEGFGITLAEAMSCGKPVVCTDWSSTTEFCHEGVALPVPCTMVPVKPGQRDNPFYHDVTEWAEPDLARAAKKLRDLFDHPELRKRIGEAGRASITRQFSVEAFRRSIVAFLDGAKN